MVAWCSATTRTRSRIRLRGHLGDTNLGVYGCERLRFHAVRPYAICMGLQAIEEASSVEAMIDDPVGLRGSNAARFKYCMHILYELVGGSCRQHASFRSGCCRGVTSQHRQLLGGWGRNVSVCVGMVIWKPLWIPKCGCKDLYPGLSSISETLLSCPRRRWLALDGCSLVGFVHGGWGARPSG